MSTPRDRDSDDLLETQMLRINRLCNEFEAAWQAGRPRALEDVLGDLAGADLQAALRDLLPLEIDYRQRAGETVALAEYAERFPNADREWLASLFYSTRVTAPSAATALPVPELLGDYQIIGRIGGGGMGTVYKALHVRMGRIVALKVLRPEIQQNPILIQRFDREVRAVARLSHPNIVAALDAREQDGVHFLITEFIEGLDLDATIRASGPLPMATAVDCALQAARGLDYAHRQGVVHRDIKPANLLRDQRGVVKVLDMGLARLDADTSVTATDLTNSGMVLGTAAYMAPEQARDGRRADARSDIYSLGCTLYYLLTGRHAFTGATALDTVLSHLSEPVPALASADASFPIELERIFARMVAKAPGDRFQTAAELIAALEELHLTPLPDQVTSIPSGVPVRDAVAPTLSLDLNSGKRETPTAVLHTTPTNMSRKVWIGGLLALVFGGVMYVVMFRGGNQEQPTVGRSALSFNGASSYVVMRKFAPVAGETYTLEAIVEPLVNRRSNVISWLGPDWMALYLNEGSWGLARRVGEESHLILARQPAALGEVVHLAGIFRGAKLQLFVSGRPVETHDSEFALPETKPGLYIGGVPKTELPEDQNDRFFGGRIHAVRITRGVRYTGPFQVPQKFTKDAQTLALYDFQAGQGNVVKDASGNGHDGKIFDAE